MPNESLVEVFQEISSNVHDDMSERDVETTFIDEDFFSVLGYEGPGKDVKNEWSDALEDNRRPDIVTQNDSTSISAAYEFKKPTESLPEHYNQLRGYVTDLEADFGVLTNGKKFRLYSKNGGAPELVTKIEIGSESDADRSDIESRLEKKEWDLTSASDVQEYMDELSSESVGLGSELARTYFFDTFQLQQQGPFMDLVTSANDLLVELRDERDAKFVKGAYRFWERSYARIPDEDAVPESWEPHVTDSNGEIDEERLSDFMFSLETGFSLLSRLFLAKACEDYNFFPNDKIPNYLRELGGFGDDIELEDYVGMTDELVGDMREDLVESLFEDDIFIWWTDGYQDIIGQTTRVSRFAHLSEEARTTVDENLQQRRQRFSRAVARITISVLKFDFSQMESRDLLGNLYQRYFDSETRKALGEFYTPYEVVELILDGVDYDVDVANDRIIDPACGSGTFLVEAVRRYLDDIRAYDNDPDWESELTELVLHPHIVGIDIHPFAVLMAQIRFMIAILPEYREAKRSNDDFTIPRFPIFRADTLRDERNPPGSDIQGYGQQTVQGWDEEDEEVKIPVEIPIESNGGDDDEFVTKTISMPKDEKAYEDAGIENFGEYFRAVQAMLDVVRAHMEELDEDTDWEYDSSIASFDLALNQYIDRDLPDAEPFFTEYIDTLLSVVEELRTEHGDGRLFKMFEDVTLSLIVKNYIQYEYVVANPPYVRNQNIPDEDKQYYKDVYEETADALFDLYIPFFQRGVDWLDEGNSLGFITPNQFMVTNYGEGVRDYLLDHTKIENIYDFRDSGVFDDAINYPAIIIAEKEPDKEERKSNTIRCIRAKTEYEEENPDEDNEETDEEQQTLSGEEEDTEGEKKELTERVVEKIQNNQRVSEYSDDDIDIFEFDQSNLRTEFWAPMPSEEWSIFEQMENQRDTKMSGLIDIHAGTQTGCNKLLVVNPVNADRIGADDTGGTVDVVPSEGGQPREVDKALLRPWLSGTDIQRWRTEWSGEHVIFPYKTVSEGGEKETKALQPDEIRDNHRATWRYFNHFEDRLKDRSSGGKKMKEKDAWYAFTYPKNHVELEKPKAIVPATDKRNRFTVDEAGEWLFKSAYGVPFPPEYQNKTRYLTALLNSKAIDYYFKHVSSVKNEGYYEYLAQYVGRTPAITSPDDDFEEAIDNLVKEILELKDLEAKIERFPRSYMEEYTGATTRVEHTWQVKRSAEEMADAVIEADTKGRYSVKVKRADQIKDKWIGTKQPRARYIFEALQYMNVDENQETTIPAPSDDEGVSRLLKKVAADKRYLYYYTNELVDKIETEFSALDYDTEQDSEDNDLDDESSDDADEETQSEETSDDSPIPTFQEAVSESVSELEELVDLHVYELFDLSENQITTIEEFLSTFSAPEAEIGEED